MASAGGPNLSDQGSNEPGVPTQTATDDMHDRPEQWSLLESRLEECRQIILPVYDKADAAASRHQRRHQWLTKIAAVAGTIAVLLVILELVWPEELHFVEVFAAGVEVFAALAALVAVALGLLVSQLNSWLIERHKAERCRLLKYSFIIDPSLWDGDAQKAQERRRRLSDDAAAVDAIRTIEQPHRWLDEVHRPAFLAQLGNHHYEEPVLRQLIAYYRANRLHAQIAYFDDRIKRFAFPDRFTRVLPQWLFFISVLAAFVHFVLVLSKRETPLGVGISVALLAALIAALLPVLGAGIRTYRMANEFGRNVKRFESTRHALNEMDRWLQEGVDAKTVFLTLWSCEHTLEIEHREWLRLMAETEWFG
jgi:hypothetical protein